LATQHRRGAIVFDEGKRKGRQGNKKRPKKILTIPSKGRKRGGEADSESFLKGGKKSERGMVKEGSRVRVLHSEGHKQRKRERPKREVGKKGGGGGRILGGRV